MPNQGWQQQQPQQQWGPPPPKRGNFAMAIIAAVGAGGVAVYWAVLGVMRIIIKRPHESEPDVVARLLATTGGNGDLLVPLSIADMVLKLLTAAVLIFGALLIVLRKMPGAFLVAGAVLLGLLAAGCHFFYYDQLGWSGTSDTYVAAGLTLVVGALAILPPVTNALKPAAGHPQGGFPQQAPPPGYGQPQQPPPGYGPPQGPPPPGYGPPR
ncbi:hypothetical protein SAMN04488074_10322 [Lentzea albidocapillata subsp. violacea]|uniref:Uncharacterized protein n=2 Tax=Lentzea albidocapillata TaxID=40571 RepID=A0A1G8W1F3_9PSEU|nr:hypothetical protein SAMN04488074_10322 [Lentzea albidocapillata subsp. violacea]